MRLIIFTILCLFSVADCYSQYFEISGKVTVEGDLAIENANVVIKGSLNGVYTDKKGAYTIKVKQGDVLSFSYLGKQTIEFLVRNGISILNVELLPQEELLDSILIKKRRGYTQKELLAEYHQNKNLIKTSLGIVDKDRASFSIRIIDGENLVPIGTDFLYSLQNLYPSMRVDRKGKNLYQPKVYLQNWSYNSQPTAIFDVDGVIYEQAPTFLLVNDIDRVAILVRNGAISRYGTAGVGGVIIINTKSGNLIANSKISRNYDNSSLRDSLYQVVNSPSVYAPEQPSYLKKIARAKSDFQAQALFERHKKEYLNSPYYFIDVSDYFFNKWGNEQRALGILAFITKRFSENVAVLRAVTFKYEELNQLELAFQVNLMILNLEPRHSQSHRNISNSYAKLKNYKSSLNGYVNYESTIKKYDSIDFNDSEVGSIMKTELANVIKLHGNQLAISDKVIGNVIESPNTRLLFEWNNDQAEFEIRIVDTENGYFSWKHLRPKDSSIKQLFFDETFKGTKYIQIIYRGNQTKNPTYLKVTLFFNYGKHTQKSESSIYRLFKEDINYQLLTVDADKNIVMK